MAEINGWAIALSASATLITGGTVGVLLERYKNRTTYLKRRDFFNPIGTSYGDEFWGKMEVYHDNRFIRHLTFATVEFENDSSKDLENLVVDFWVDNDNQILGSKANYVEGGTSIHLEKEFNVLFQEAANLALEHVGAEKTDPNYKYPKEVWAKISVAKMNRRFQLPVLNKHTTVSFNLLLENYKGQLPLLRSNVTGKGVGWVMEDDKEKQNKRTFIRVAKIGLIIFIIGIVVLLVHYGWYSIPVILTGALGLLYNYLALFIYSAFRYIRRLFL